MPRIGSKTDRDALRFVRAVAIVAVAWGLLRGLAHPDRSVGVLLVTGVVALLFSVAAPSLLLPPARLVFRALTAVGDVVSTVLLTALYLLVVWPWQRILILLGAIASPDEPWPPKDESGWIRMDGAVDSVARRSRPGAWWASALTQAGGAVALVRYLYQRPFAFVVPVLVILLLLAVVVLAGNATGLGPLVYTLF